MTNFHFAVILVSLSFIALLAVYIVNQEHRPIELSNRLCQSEQDITGILSDGEPSADGTFWKPNGCHMYFYSTRWVVGTIIFYFKTPSLGYMSQDDLALFDFNEPICMWLPYIVLQERHILNVSFNDWMIYASHITRTAPIYRCWPFQVLVEYFVEL